METRKHAAWTPSLPQKTGGKWGWAYPFSLSPPRKREGVCLSRPQREKARKVTVTYSLSHIDRRPLGDIDGTVRCLKATHPEVHLRYQYVKIER